MGYDLVLQISQKTLIELGQSRRPTVGTRAVAKSLSGLHRYLFGCTRTSGSLVHWGGNGEMVLCGLRSLGDALVGLEPGLGGAGGESAELLLGGSEDDVLALG
jgi:hypothetical protein